jgi:hypothetical protein
VVQPANSPHAVITDVAKIMRAIKRWDKNEKDFHFSIAWHPQGDKRKDEIFNEHISRVFRELEIMEGYRFTETTNPRDNHRWERVSYTIQLPNNRVIEHILNARFFNVRREKGFRLRA